MLKEEILLCYSRHFVSMCVVACFGGVALMFAFSKYIQSGWTVTSASSRDLWMIGKRYFAFQSFLYPPLKLEASRWGSLTHSNETKSKWWLKVQSSLGKSHLMSLISYFRFRDLVSRPHLLHLPILKGWYGNLRSQSAAQRTNLHKFIDMRGTSKLSLCSTSTHMRRYHLLIFWTLFRVVRRNLPHRCTNASLHATNPHLE